MVARLLRAVPNALSLARLALGIGFPWVPEGWWLVVVVVAALSDVADGAISRRFHVSGATGRILDPVADKAFVLCVVATLLFEGRLEFWEVALIGLRDWAVLLGACWLFARRNWSAFRRMPPRLLGKATTALQFLFILIVLIDGSWARPVFVPAAIVSGAAALDYLRVFRRQRGD